MSNGQAEEEWLHGITLEDAHVILDWGLFSSLPCLLNSSKVVQCLGEGFYCSPDPF